VSEPEEPVPMTPVEPMAERTVQRLQYLAGEAMRRLEREEPDRFARLVATGSPVVWLRDEATNDVVCTWGEEIERLDGEEYRQVDLDDAPTIWRGSPAVPEDLSTLDDVPALAELATQGDAVRMMVALSSAALREDVAEFDLLLADADARAVLATTVGAFVRLAGETWGAERFGDMLTAWRPGRRLGPDLLDET